MIRAMSLEIIELETGLAYATNPGNLRLQLADALRELPPDTSSTAEKGDSEPELVIDG